tara:strand:+ start:19105 stop:19518 length:414 start_codon:yes stop_codon:yes gene_type:complete
MKIIVTILATAMMLTGSLISSKKTTITATVVNVSGSKGKVSFALHNKTTFMKEPLQAIAAEIIDGKSTVVFEGLEPGEYAIICLHDKNENNKMDFAPSGMPLEDYGASNNVMNFGPPTFSDSKFTVADKDLTLEIKF